MIYLFFKPYLLKSVQVRALDVDPAQEIFK